MSLTYTATSLEDIAKQFDDRAKAADAQAAAWEQRRGNALTGNASGLGLVQARAYAETWRAAAEMMRATTLHVPGPREARHIKDTAPVDSTTLECPPGSSKALAAADYSNLELRATAALVQHADRLDSALYDMIGNVDYTQNCCSPFSPVAAALPEDVLAEARDAVLQYRNFKKG